MNNSLLFAQKLSVNYDAFSALSDINFEIPREAFLAIIGPNGAGKSTLIKLIIGILKPDSGILKIDGSKPGDKTAARVGYVPQFKNMNRHFPALAEELVYSGLKSQWPWRIKSENKELVAEALRTVKAEKLALQPIKQLSGGEIQRVCLARSIVNKPDIIVLDEPATGIDMVGEADMYNLLETYQKENKATIIMITHDWHAARHHASHVLLINKRQIAFGSPGETLSDANLRKAFGHTGHHHAQLHMGNDDA